MIPSREHNPELDKYEVYEEIGHGGMATVYRGRDRRLDREVAIKMIHRHLRENREVAARFVSEARAVAKVKHPNIVEVYDVSSETDDEQYLVVELVRGTTLRKLLADRGAMPAEVAVALALEIGGGLQHAHEQNVVHRDVKPENVLVDLSSATSTRVTSTEARGRSSCVKITDFGIAKLLDAQGVTATGQVLGSPAHMAPEQIEGGEVDARADVFGLGVLLYECLVGRLPFDGKNPAQVLRRVLDGSYVPAERARPTVGATWSRIVAKALAREAKDRYASVAEFVRELQSELTRLGFEEPYRELNDWLADPEAYQREYVPRLVERLLALGRRARAQRELAVAAAAFNRALALRPDDPELMKEVAKLARRERFAKVASRAALLTGVTAVVAGLVAAGVRSFRDQAEPQPTEGTQGQRSTQPDEAAPGEQRSGAARGAGPTRPSGRPSAIGEVGATNGNPQRQPADPRVPTRAQTPSEAGNAASTPSTPSSSGGSPSSSAGTPSTGTPSSAAGSPNPVGTPSTATPAGPSRPVATPTQQRRVRVVVRGGSGGGVKIDGQPHDWLGQQIALTVGPHTFEFVPPNAECCKAPPPRVVQIEPDTAGTGEPQTVYGTISFHDATLQMNVPEGAQVTCGALFADKQVGPGQRRVPMGRPEVSDSCTILPPPGETSPPKRIDVTLRPGRTSYVSWP